MQRTYKMHHLWSFLTCVILYSSHQILDSSVFSQIIQFMLWDLYRFYCVAIHTASRISPIYENENNVSSFTLLYLYKKYVTNFRI